MEREEKVEIKIISKRKLWNYLQPFAIKPAIGILFSGERFECCDEVLAAFENNQFLGAVTLSSKGEMMSGQPTIVALWVSYQYRRKGIGQALLEAAIRRMIERGLTPVQLDSISSKADMMIERLPQELKKVIKVFSGGPCDSVLDM